MSTIANLMVSLGLDSKKFEDGVDGAEKSSGRLSKGLGTVGKVVAGATAAVVAGGVAAGAAMIKYGNFADEVLDLSSITGMSTDEIQKWRQVATDAGVDVDTVANNMQTLNGQLERGNDLSPRLAKGFETMGISAEEFKEIEPDDQMRKIVDTMMELDGADRNAFANQMNMADMLPMIDEMEASGMDLEEIMNEIDVPFDEDDLEKMNEFRQAWDNFKKMLFEVLGQALMPLFEWFSANMPLIEQITETAFEAIGTVFAVFKEVIGTVIEVIRNLFTSNEENMNGIWETIMTVFTQVKDFLQETWETITEFWNENGQAILDYVVFYFNQIWDTVKLVFESVWGIIEGVLNDIVPFVQEQLDRIMQFWNENGEQIMEAVDNAFSFIQAVIEFVMPIIQAIIEGAWNIIKTIFETAVGLIMGIVETFAALLTGDFEGVKDALIGIWETLWDGIKGIVEGAWVLVSGAFGALWDNISGWFTGLVDDAFDWGKGLIDGFIDGIKSMAGAVGRAVEGVIDNVAGFLKFWSPAKKGEGRFITHWGSNMVDGFLDGVKKETSQAGKMMDDLVKTMQPSANLDMQSLLPDGHAAGLVARLPSTQTKSSGSGNTDTNKNNNNALNGMENLLIELIKAVREGKYLQIDGKTFAEVTGDYTDEESGKRVRKIERGLAT